MHGPDESMAALERAFEALLRLARQDAAVAAELEASVPLFFEGAAPLADPASSWLVARRHAEWFLLERHSLALLGAPVERLLGLLREALAAESRGGAAGGAARDALGGAPGDSAEDLAVDALLASTTGAFEVEEVRPGEGAWLRDVAGLTQYALHAPDLSARLTVGDLLVGRLYPVGGGSHIPSPAAAVFRGAGLVAALERDLADLRRGPGAKLVRLSQAELERMFFRPGGPAGADAGPSRPGDPAEVVAEGRRWLAERGLAPAEVDALLARLGAAPLDPHRVAPGLGDVLGDILDELAFETAIDLDDARRRLLEVWRAASALASEPHGSTGATHAAPEAAPRAAESGHRGASDEARRRAVDEFALNRAAGRDVRSELATLRAALGLDVLDGDEDAEEEDTPAPDFPGVVGALVHELVWETGVTEGEAAARDLAPLAHLARFAAPIGLLEDLGGRELVRFASFWIIERDVLADGRAARDLVAALRRFGEWCRDAHDHDVMELLAPALDGLESSLPRVVRANRELLAPARAAAADAALGDVYEVLDDAASLFADPSGEEVSLTIEPRVRTHLARGDRLRGTPSSGVLSVLRVYPPEAALGR